MKTTHKSLVSKPQNAMSETMKEREPTFGFPLSLMKNPKLSEALAKFQSKHCNAARDGKGNFGAYVTLVEAELAVSPATEFGISHTFLMRGVSETKAYVGIKLMHSSGEHEFSELPIFFNKGRNPYHEMGSGVTYVRRYLLLAAYGLGQADDEADTFSRETKDNTGNYKKQEKEKPAPWSKPELTVIEGIANDEQPLDEERRNLVIGLIKEMPKKDQTKFLNDFRKHFGLPGGQKVQGEITAVKHENFIASWTP